MDDFNIKEEVYKCSKCGLCQSVCPVFLVSKNELYSPRGRFNVLNNFFNNSIPLSKKFLMDLDICLNCEECKNFCPSNIDSVKIFSILKKKYNKKLFPFCKKYNLILFFHSIIKLFTNKIKQKNFKSLIHLFLRIKVF